MSAPHGDSSNEGLLWKRQHGGYSQWRHRHVDDHPVTFLDPMSLQGVGKAAGRLQKLLEGET